MRAPFGSQAPEPIPAEVFPRDLSLSALTKTVAAKLHVTTSNLSERDGAEVILVRRSGHALGKGLWFSSRNRPKWERGLVGTGAGLP